MTYRQKPPGRGDEEQSATRTVVSRRSMLEIRMDILRAVIEGAEGPTQIMYRANLSWILLCDHLRALSEQGYVSEKVVGNRKKYSLTGKGSEIVAAYLNLIREVILDSAASPI
jgi:predicted transcriptional regulator